MGTGGGDTVAAFFANGKIESLTDVTFANVERFALDLGGGASDTLSYASTTVDVTVNLRAGTGTGFISVLGVEHVTGGSGNDADGDAATHYQFWDDGAAGDNGYFWTPSNEHNPLGVLITISAASSLTLGCAAARCRAPRRCGVRAFDGTTWSAWDSFAVMTV